MKEKLLLAMSLFTTTFRGKMKKPFVINYPYKLSLTQKSWIYKIENRVAIEDIDGDNVNLMKNIRNNKIHQVCSGFYIHKTIDLDEKDYKTHYVQILNGNKWELLTALVKRLLPAQILIWVTYTYEYGEVIKHLKPLCDIRQYKKSLKEPFRKGEFKAMVCHTRSAGAGNDFSFCDYAIYINATASGIDFNQSSYRMSQYKGATTKTIFRMYAPEVLQSVENKSIIDDKIKNLDEFYQEGEL